MFERRFLDDRESSIIFEKLVNSCCFLILKFLVDYIYIASSYVFLSFVGLVN